MYNRHKTCVVRKIIRIYEMLYEQTGVWWHQNNLVIWIQYIYGAIKRKSVMWLLFSIRLMCFSLLFWHLIRFFPIWVCVPLNSVSLLFYFLIVTVMSTLGSTQLKATEFVLNPHYRYEIWIDIRIMLMLKLAIRIESLYHLMLLSN